MLILVGLALGGTAFAVANEKNDSPEDTVGILSDETRRPVTYAPDSSASTEPRKPSDAVPGVVRALRSGGVRAVTVRPVDTKVSIAVAMGDFDETVSQVWFADLAYGAVLELMTGGGTSSTYETVDAASVEGISKTGTPLRVSLGVGAVALGQRFSSPVDEILVSQVTGAATTHGLKVGSVDVFHPLESAIRVKLVVPQDMKPSWTLDELRAALIGRVPAVEGVLIELVDESGAPLLTSGVAYRTGGGGLWFAKGQDHRFGAIHGGHPSGD